MKTLSVQSFLSFSLRHVKNAAELLSYFAAVDQDVKWRHCILK